MSLQSFYRRLANRGVADTLQRVRDLLLEPDQLFEPPELLEKPQGARVMVIAPHPDDETLGCGGTLHKHHIAHDHITAVFMTDGSKGNALVGNMSPQALVKLREDEARAAAAVLGIDECVFLRNQDMYLERSSKTTAQLREVIEAHAPEVMYLPSPFDTHRDHQQACLITAHALAAYGRSVQVYLYEVWAPVCANCAVVIDLERKIEAIRCYRSQMDSRQLYVIGAAALAQYRAVTCLSAQNAGNVECFLRLDRARFIEFIRGIF